MKALGGIFDFDTKHERLTKVLRELEDPKIWDNAEKAQTLGKERGQLESVVNNLIRLEKGIADAEELLAMAVEEDDEESVKMVALDLKSFEKDVQTWNSAACSSGKWTPIMPFSIFKPEQVALKLRIGLRCCCACTCAGESVEASKLN